MKKKIAPQAAIKTQKDLILLDLSIADHFFSRLVGLLTKPALSESQALWIIPCNSIHTIGMNYHLDVVFLNAQKEIIQITENLAPFRMKKHAQSISVIEFKSGFIQAHKITVGSQLIFCE